jgi:hypothetical protein
MEVDVMEEEESNDEAAEKVEMKEKDCQTKEDGCRTARPELSSEEEMMAEFSTVKSRKKPKKKNR